jgi:hypothetical protein
MDRHVGQRLVISILAELRDLDEQSLRVRLPRPPVPRWEPQPILF